jgi:hypothetical protein
MSINISNAQNLNNILNNALQDSKIDSTEYQDILNELPPPIQAEFQRLTSDGQFSGSDLKNLAILCNETVKLTLKSTDFSPIAAEVIAPSIPQIDLSSTNVDSLDDPFEGFSKLNLSDGSSVDIQNFALWIGHQHGVFEKTGDDAYIFTKSWQNDEKSLLQFEQFGRDQNSTTSNDLISGFSKLNLSDGSSVDIQNFALWIGHQYGVFEKTGDDSYDFTESWKGNADVFLQAEQSGHEQYSNYNGA